MSADKPPDHKAARAFARGVLQTHSETPLMPGAHNCCVAYLDLDTRIKELEAEKERYRHAALSSIAEDLKGAIGDG